MELPEHPRRRYRSSYYEFAQSAFPPSNTSATTIPEHFDGSIHGPHADVASGFVDIYQTLTPRQVGVIAVGSAIGTGLMIGTARALTLSGLWLGCESYTTHLWHHLTGNRYWLKYAIVTPNQLTAAALIISYWVDADWINPGVWISILLFVIVLVNFVHHGLPSRVEFYVSSLKLIIMSALIVLSMVIALGGGPDHDARGFRYWNTSGVFGIFGARVNRGLLEKFLDICATMSSATFAFIGSERSGIMVRQPNIRKAISRAIKHTFYRVLVFHLLGITLLGMLVPRDSTRLSFARGSAKGAAASPFVAAIYLSGIAVVPDILNGCILLFVLSIANYDLYLTTKAMCDLSLKGRAPSFLHRTNRRGVPIYALGVSASVATLAYANVASDSQLVFGYFVNTVTMLGLLVWISILITHIAFVRARKAQGIPDDALTFRARFGLVGTWLGLILCLFISMTMILGTFTFDNNGKLKFHYQSAAASFVGLPIFLILIVGYKIVVRSKRVNSRNADMWTGKLDS
ncbi:Amino acid/polyamine transporter I [Penicillium odoratum]|uniref:Amino acid/polyamine transporter I n=1 Tax=Penicillium odoratum TaxID=1167516 RepID=UPI00254793BD|nr:Amino acid/polyamine transporter I [Penicillium odoratum]KAJ5776956.1 Amino acid/polyamine transporter I [Penicillium odoratum]